MIFVPFGDQYDFFIYVVSFNYIFSYGGHHIQPIITWYLMDDIDSKFI
jgi:hypothetical protein